MSAFKMITYNEHLPVLLGSNVNLINDFDIDEGKRPRKMRFAQASDPIKDSRNNGFSRKFWKF